MGSARTSSQAGWVVPLERRVLLALYGPDPTFRVDVTATALAEYIMKLLFDGKILDELTKVKSDGSIDTSFGADGFLVFPNGTGQWGGANDVAVTVTSKGILFAADGTSQPGTLTRYRFDGAVDTTFGTDGTITLPFELQTLAE